MPYEYYRIQAGPPGEQGIDGGIGAIRDAPLAGGRPTTQVTVPVADLDEVLARVESADGRIVEPKLPIPGIGWYATCAEPGGLLFGRRGSGSALHDSCLDGALTAASRWHARGRRFSTRLHCH